MEQIIIGGSSDSPSTTAEQYNFLQWGTSYWNPTDNRYILPMPTTGSFSNLYVRIYAAPGAGKRYLFKLRKNGVDTALSAEITGSEFSGSDTTNIVDVAPWDRISLSCTPEGATAPAATGNNWWSIKFTGSTKESLLLGGTADNFETTATDYNYVTCQSPNDIYEPNMYSVIPTSGSIKNLYVIANDIITSGNQWRFTLRKNGVDTTLTCVVTGSIYSGSDITHTVTVVPGDLIDMQITPEGLNINATYARWGMVFTAENDGEALILGGNSDNLSNSTTEMNVIGGNQYQNTWSTTESNRLEGCQRCYLKNLWVYLSGSPGVGKNYTLTVRTGSIGTGSESSELSVIISDTLQAGSNDSNIVSLLGNTMHLSMQSAPSGTPAITNAFWGLVITTLTTSYADILEKVLPKLTGYKN